MSKIHVKSTVLGFLRGEFLDRYGMSCIIQKSALAGEDCIWLGADEPGKRVWMHLTQGLVRDLLPLLQTFADTGELVMPEQAEAPAFEPEDFAHTATLLRENMNGKGAVFQAVCSNNLSIILAALDALSQDVGDAS